ncbi:hypothetical protein PAXINDRAFT_168530, partial [Paxillus involutus ATCC 200175]
PATSTVSQSRTRGGREVDDDNGEDDDDDGAHVVPQHPEPTCQTAVDEPADTSNPNPTSARPTVPVGKSNGPSSKGVEGSGEWGERLRKTTVGVRTSATCTSYPDQLHHPQTKPLDHYP